MLYDDGHIYKGSYEGWYSVSDEAFLSTSQVTDGMEPESKVGVVFSAEALLFIGACLEFRFLWKRVT